MLFEVGENTKIVFVFLGPLSDELCFWTQ